MNNDKVPDLESQSPDEYGNGEKKRTGSVGSTNPTGRRLSRIDRTVEEADSDSSIGFGAQIEMEKENAIKYRTCSWQKVRLPFCVSNKPLQDESISLSQPFLAL